MKRPSIDEYYIYGNSDLLKEVWLNLIDNAIKYAYEETVLEIKIQQINYLLKNFGLYKLAY